VDGERLTGLDEEKQLTIEDAFNLLIRIGTLRMES
jgi:hypothetical protein